MVYAMPVFRIFRRLLLCFVVGVTIFGVAGWLLRPKPKWEVTLSTKDRQGGWLKAIPVIEPEENTPIWLGWDSTNESDEKVRQFHLVAIDPKTGETTADHRRPVDEPWALKLLSDGALLRMFRNKEDGVERTEVEYIPCRGQSTTKLMLEGRWRTYGDGRHVWRLKPITNGFQFLKVAVPSGKIESSLDFLGEYPFASDEVSTVSDDGRLLAFHKLDESGNLSPAGVEIWDVLRRQKLRSVRLPPNESNRVSAIHSEWASMSFQNAMLFLHYSKDEDTGSDRFEWQAGPDAVEFAKVNDVVRPVSRDGSRPIEIRDATPGRRVWVAIGFESGQTEFCVGDDQGRTGAWKTVPFQVALGDTFGYGDGATQDCAFAVVPARNQSVCMTIDPTIASILPKSLSSGLPADWRAQKRINTRWHDWISDEWRNVGSPTDEVLCQLRPNAYITRKTSWDDDESTLQLQSWPLPPRDPKWLAAAVAGLSFLATWRLCSRRTKTRARLVKN